MVPFDAHSVIGFVYDLTNATGSLMGGHYKVVSKSSITGVWNDVNSGDNFGAKLSKSGFDTTSVRGIADKPVYSFIKNSQVSICSLEYPRGMTTEKTEHANIDKLKDKYVGITFIGFAGERMSNMAATVNYTHRAAGGGDSGAVMGSKYFKAIICYGEIMNNVFSKSDVLAINKEAVDRKKNRPIDANMLKLFGDYGTGALYERSVICGEASTRNWGGLPSELTEREIEALSSQKMDKFYKKKKLACLECSLDCGTIHEIPDGEYPLLEKISRPEYEISGMCISMRLNRGAKVVDWCSVFANKHSFDTILLSATIAWAMERHIRPFRCTNNA